MSMLTRTAAGLGAVAIVAPVIALSAVAPAHADGKEREGRCGTGKFDFQVERENGGFDVTLDLDNLRPGQRWVVALRHDGKVYTKVTRTVDREGDIEIDRRRPNTAGSDTFKFRAYKVGGGASCSSTIQFSR